MAKKMISMKVNPNLLKAIDLFCLENELTRTEYFERLAEHYLKKRGRIITKTEVVQDWDSVEEMPATPQVKQSTWIRTA